MKDRADKLLVTLGLVKTRSKAQLLIQEGCVYCDGEKIQKPGQLISSEKIKVCKDIVYVGRGGEKLEAAVSTFGLDFLNRTIADIGASTGGFTEVALRRGASRVYAIDVGTGQLDSSLREDSRVVNMEGLNVKYPFELPEKIDIAVVDVSFISLTKILENVWVHLKETGEAVVLVKPQYESTRKDLSSNGVIRHDAIRRNVLKKIYHWCNERNFHIIHAARSPIKGKKGNEEFFFHLTVREGVLVTENDLEKL